MNKALTISVAAYNVEKYLEKCLDSFCVPEIMKDIEVLIVNDGSTDRTAEIAAEYVAKYPATFILINKENGGHGSTINTGIQAASGKYFKLVDADDWVERDGLIQLVEILKEQEVDAVLSPYYMVEAENGKKTRMACYPVQAKSPNLKAETKQMKRFWNPVMHTITYRTAILQKNFLPIDEHCFYVDVEYVFFYFRYVENVLIADTPVYNYLVGTSGQSVNMHNMVKRREQHLRVCKRLLELIAEPSCRQTAIQSIIKNCVVNHYRILMHIEEGKQSKTELQEFDKYLKASYPEIYRTAITYGIGKCQKTTVIVWALRNLGFHFYGLLHRLIRLVG